MQEIEKFFENIWHMKIVNSIIVILVSVIIYKLIAHFLNKSEGKARTKLFTSNKGKTYIKLIRSVIRSIFIIITTLIVLQINGIDVSSILAGVGILGVVFGFAIQDWLKDVIRGSSILSDNYFEVGDIIKYKDIEGKVLVIGLKTTKIEDLKNNNIISIANRNIEQVEIVSKYIYVRVPMPYEVPLEKAERAMNEIVEKIKENDNVNDSKYKGVTELADSSIEYLVEIECDPQFKLQVRRDVLRTTLLVLEENKIEVPYKQIDIHNK